MKNLFTRRPKTSTSKATWKNWKTFFLTYDPQPPVMDPNRFKGICMEVGATFSLFSTLHDAMSSDRMSDERQELTKLRVMVVIYIMMDSQSQPADWFQVSLARTL
jgi:hypothetical protein